MFAFDFWFFLSCPVLAIEMPEKIEKGLPSVWNQHRLRFSANESIQEFSFASIKDFQIEYSHAGETPMQAGSISKVISTTAALSVLNKHEILTSEKIHAYVKNYFADIDCPDQDFTWFDHITFDQIFSHRSGLGIDVLGRNRCLSFYPGSDFAYSGAGFHLLQNAIEEITQAQLETVAKREVFSKLDLHSSTFLLSAFDRVFENAAFSLVASPVDLATFLIELASPQKLDSQLVEFQKSPIYSLNPNLEWGRGIGIYKCGRDRVLWHWGSNMGTHHSLAFIVEGSGLGAVLMTEGEKESSLQFLKNTANLILPCPEYAFWDDVIK